MNLIRIVIALFILIFSEFSESVIEECGNASSNSDSLPWNVGIYVQNQDELELICFGSLIKSKAILTAAHCVCDDISGKVRDNSFYISTGRLQKKIHLTNENVHKISKLNIIPTKTYKGLLNYYSDDLALIKLDEKINKEIQPVCVDWGNSIRDVLVTAKLPYWNGTEANLIIQNFIEESECMNSCSKSFVPFITSEKICSKSKEKMTKESLGSGVVFLNPENNLWYIKGVMNSFDPEKGDITLLTSIQRYMNWMSNVCARL